MPYANNNGVKIYYEVEGNGSPIILAHGLSTTLEMWRVTGYTQQLSKDYRLILVDTRGHGKSDKPENPDSYSQEVIAADYVAVLDALETKKAHYFGYSMGGKIGFSCIARYDQPRFQSLILGGISPYRTNAETQISKVRLEAQKVALEKGFDHYLKYLETVAGPATTPEIKAQRLSINLKVLNAFCSKYEFWPAAEDVLPKINLPCLIFAGTEDPRYSGAAESVNHMPNASFVSFSGLTHAGCLQRSDLVLPLVKKFLAEVNERKH